MSHKSLLPVARILWSANIFKTLRFFIMCLELWTSLKAAHAKKKKERNKEKKMKNASWPSTPPVALQSAALIRLLWQPLEMCLALVACLGENAWESENRKRGTWKAVKLRLSSLLSYPFNEYIKVLVPSSGEATAAVVGGDEENQPE